ncbi:uncharacterized protein E0L32_002662 [Thyridium curvatum]|uniref:HNH domain-containing protein n=1 Tax=Thyridium curvatum TaxID=1093900 RepID=A0A507BF92_9PEZI|nr:uncharacterized protein E0L32_002662 [Thyridium curvatum]TPX18153.1 hypothetical protein E0L32_002662 [Thyridium curvatum]
MGREGPRDGVRAENYEKFREAFSEILIEQLSSPQKKKKPHRRGSKRSRAPVAAIGGLPPPAAPEAGPADDDDAADLADFIDYVASEAFDDLPADLQDLTHQAWADNADALQTRYDPATLTGARVAEAILPAALDPSVADSLRTYGLADEATRGVDELLASALSAYVARASAAPPAPRSAAGRADACEICGRDWVALTYHHLVPRLVHDKAVRRRWRRADELQSVAWLCGACHAAVHRFAGHEDLARRYYTVELLLEQDEIRRFAAWVGRVRWKKR